MNCRFTPLFSHHTIVLGVAVCLSTLGCRGSAAVSPADPQSAGSAPSHTSRSSASRISWSGTQQVSVTDPQMGITAATLDIPSGWKFVGDVTRFPGCHSLKPAIDLSAVAQDGVTALILLPGEQWFITPPSLPGNARMNLACPLIGITSPAEFLVDIAVPNIHPDARIETVLPLAAEDQADVAQQLEQMRQKYAQQPMLRSTQVALNGARARVEYVRNGQPVEEMLTAVLLCTQSQQTGKSCTARAISAIRAPKGQLDAVLAEPAMKSIPKSMHVNQEWTQRLQQQSWEINQKENAERNGRFRDAQRENQDRFNQIMNNSRAQDAQRTSNFNHAMAADRAQQNAIDQSAHNTANYALDRKDYINPATGQTITSSSEYNHQWMNSSGDTLVQTDDPTLDPNGAINPIRDSWIELVPK